MERREGKLSSLGQALGELTIDVFVGSASFEQRCLSVINNLDVSRVAVAVLGCNVTYLSSVMSNLSSMEGAFTGDVRRMDYYSDDPVRSAHNMINALGAVFEGSPKRLVMDITTFTREALLMVLLLLRRMMRRRDSLELLYVHAREYSVGRDDDEKWLSKGIMEVRSVLGCPGEMSPSRPTHMIVMAGFEFERAVEIVRICEPSIVSVGFADDKEPGTMRHQGLNERVVGRLRRAFRDVGTFTFRAYDALGARADLRKQIGGFRGYNVVVVPMHTKISTVGTALLAFERDDVQLCYAPAKIYNVGDYALAGDEYYWFTLPELSH